MKNFQPPVLTPPLGMSEPLLVTTSTQKHPAQIARAEALAERFGVPYVPRRCSASRMRRDYNLELVYIVRSDREEVQGLNHSLFSHPGMFSLKRKDGLTHPLLRAIHPEGDPPLETVLDATFGMGGDAFHIAGLLKPEKLIGVERSPILHALLEEGIPRLAQQGRRWSRGASSIELHCEHALTFLSRLEASSVDVVYLDPMFEVPSAGNGTFYMLRKLAIHEVPSQALLDQAFRVARRRVVWKLPAAVQPPAQLQAPGPGWNKRVRGGAVDYSIIERNASHS